MTEIEQLINEVCAKQHVNYKQLAGILGVAPNTVYRWVKGETRPKGPAIVLLQEMKEEK